MMLSKFREGRAHRGVEVGRDIVGLYQDEHVHQDCGVRRKA